MISFKSKTGNNILNYYFINPHSESYINQLANILDLDPSNTEKKLKEFEREGLLVSEFKGNQRYYRINGSFSLLDQYRQIFLKTIGLEQKLKKILASGEGVEEAYIFGSYAKNQMDASSDIDLLIVGKHQALLLQRELNKIQKEIGREINVIDMTPAEFDQKKKYNDPLIKNIFSSPHIKLV